MINVKTTRKNIYVKFDYINLKITEVNEHLIAYTPADVDFINVCDHYFKKHYSADLKSQIHHTNIDKYLFMEN